MEKIKIDKVIVVEGKYDKIKLSSLLDAYILTTEGFGIFKNDEKKELFRRLAAERGLIVASDADGAGLVIRNYFNSIIPKESLFHVYIPAIAGKEKRKDAPSKEGTLGVEGMEAQLLRERFLPFASDASPVSSEEITLFDLYEDGFRGKEGSEEKRKAFLQAAGLPMNLSAKALVGAVNLFGGKNFYESVKKTLNHNES
ncbi:MAG: DUF4093 domain-containing protein [Clostridia bacterium]|nr:DUF4093 domain-containing protein [Clostridia bacterium]